MNQAIRFALIAGVMLIGACNKDQPAEPPKAAQPAPDPAAMAPPPPAAVGQSCSQDCGNGVKSEILCAEGETPVCTCTPSPTARCEAPASAGQ